MHNNSNFLYKPSNKNVPVILKKTPKKPISVLLNSSNCLALSNFFLLTSIYLYAKCRQCMLKNKCASKCVFNEYILYQSSKHKISVVWNDNIFFINARTAKALGENFGIIEQISYIIHGIRDKLTQRSNEQPHVF